MRKAISVLVMLGLIVGAMALPAEAGKKKKKKPKKVERVVESNYEAPAIGSGTGVCLRPTNSCGDIATGADEKWVTVEITDLTGLPVYFSLGQDTDPDTLGTESDLGEHCGKTEEPIQIEPGYSIIVFPWALGPTCGSIATQGTVKATLSNLP